MYPDTFSPETILHQRYQLNQLLGEAPSRQTWLATDQHSHDQVVIKLLIFGRSMEWQDLKLFEREAQVLQQLDHPAIPNYRDHFSNPEPPSWFASVYTYIPGRSLKDLLDQRQPFSNQELRWIATEVLDILIYLHGNIPTILHRDIKPSNLIWGEDNTIYLVDFGAVQTQESTPGKTFTVVGTYGYTPVEQYGGRPVPASDLYALGTTLIHLATGLAPADLPQKEMRLQFQDWIDLKGSQSLEPSLIYWLKRMTDPILEHRIQSAEEALDLLSSREIVLRSPAARIFKPQHTPIQVYRTQEYLRIQIPNPIERNLRFKDIMGWVKSVFLIGFSSLLFIFWIGLIYSFVLQPHPFLAIFNIFLTISFTTAVLRMLTRVELILTRSYIDIKSCIFNWIFRRQQIAIDEIDDIFRERDGINRKQARNFFSWIGMFQFRLGIRTIDDDEFYLGPHKMEWDECVWIDREINDWLKHHLY